MEDVIKIYCKTCRNAYRYLISIVKEYSLRIFRGRAGFVSLKWKVFFALNIVLLVVGGLVTHGISDYLYQSYNDREDEQYNILKLQVSGMMKNSRDKVLEISEIILSSRDIRESIKSKDTKRIISSFSEYWNSISNATDIENIALYSNQAIRIGRWGNSVDEPRYSTYVENTVAIKNSIASEQPISYLECTYHCSVYVAYPVLLNGKVIGAMVTAARIVDVVLAMSHATGADIGVVVKVNPEDYRQSSILNKWGYRVTALTNRVSMFDLLLNVQLQHGIIDNDYSISYQHMDGNVYRINFVDLDNQVKPPKLIIVLNETERLQAIKNKVRYVGAIGLVGVAVSQFFIALLLWKPLRRIEKTARALPLLANNQYDDVRSSVLQGLHKNIFKDEIDVLDETTVELSYQLELVHASLEKKKESFRASMLVMRKQRDFVSRLLNSAKIIVITLSSDFTIRSMNKYGEEMTGHNSESIVGNSFFDKFSVDEGFYGEIGEMINGKTDTVKNETTINTDEGNVRNIDWVHSILPAVDDSQVMILSVGTDITPRKQVEQRLSWLADHDPLTGLFNRRRFNQELATVLEESERYPRKGALFYIDLDNFKDVNDSVGHHAGDIVLKTVSLLLKKLIRSTDVVARFGGDEFCVLLKEVDEERALRLANKLEDELQSKKIVIEGNGHRIGCSVGIALYPEHGATTADLLSNADIAMYQAKKNGRGGIYMYSETDQGKKIAHDRMYWKEEIHDAIMQDRFSLHYQPIMNVVKNEVSHYEVLIRMISPMARLIPPIKFIPVAERSELIYSIDRWVVRNAIYKLAELHRNGHNITFSINVSGKAVNDEQFLPMIQQLLKETDIDPTKIIFEVTETVAVSDFEQAEDLINKLKSLGCQLALDDFGVGYSSFYYMKKLPLDFVKIDGSFIKELHARKDDQVFVKALSEVARGFGKKTIAEFVENEMVLKLLREYNVDYAQGYYIGKPSDKLVHEQLDIRTYAIL